MPENDEIIDPLGDVDCCYYDKETGKFYKLEYDDHWEPKNFSVNEEGIISWIGNKENYEIKYDNGGTVLINHEDYTSQNSSNTVPEPVTQPEPKKRGRKKKVQ